MTPERQRIKIAELQGWESQAREVKQWTVTDYQGGGEYIYKLVSGYSKGVEWVLPTKLPDYINSRDALAPVLAGLDWIAWAEFEMWIHFILQRTNPEIHVSVALTCSQLLLATPAQLFEAYLRTKGEWEE